LISDQSNVIMTQWIRMSSFLFVYFTNESKCDMVK